jgi:hypothetical protein
MINFLVLSMRLKEETRPGVVVDDCNPSTQEAEAEESQVQGQHGLHSETLSERREKEREKKKERKKRERKKEREKEGEGERKEGRKEGREGGREEGETRNIRLCMYGTHGSWERAPRWGERGDGSRGCPALFHQHVLNYERASHTYIFGNFTNEHKVKKFMQLGVETLLKEK